MNGQQTDQVRLIACPRPLSTETDRIDRYVPEGGTVAEHVRALGWQPDHLSARVFIDGEYIEQAQWEYAVPRAGQALTVRVIPMGGGGGQGKEAGRIVAMLGVIALSIFAPYLAPVGWGLVGAWTGAALSVAVSIVGTLAINALIPPASPKLAQLSGQAQASPSIAAAQNHLTPYAPIPRIYGRIRVFPNYGARPYTEIVGSDQYLRLLFVLGYGPLSISELKIGDTPVEQFDDLQMEVRPGYVTDPPVTLYPDTVSEEPLSLLVTNASGGVIRTSKPNTDELSVDITLPGGLYVKISDGRGNFPTALSMDIEYRAVGTSTWIHIPSTLAVAATLTTALPGPNNDLILTAATAGAAGNNLILSYVDEGPAVAETVRLINTSEVTVHIQVILRNVASVYSTSTQVKAAIEAATSLITVAHAPGNTGVGTVTPIDPLYLTGGADAIEAITVNTEEAIESQLRINRQWKTSARGQFEVRVTRTQADSSDSRVVDLAFWTNLRSITAAVPIEKAGLALVAMRIRGTNQLNGVIDNFNCVVESILPDWDAAKALWVTRPTSNPASIVRDVHQGASNARPKLDSRMDLTTLQAFHGRCVTKGFTFNANIDFRTTIKELTRDVLAAGRGTPGLRDGKVSVIEDIPQSIPVHALTPRNSWGYRGSKVFADLPHALKVRFIDPDTLQQDERTVLNDGHGITGTDGIRRDAFGLPTTSPEATRFETVDAGLGVTDSDQLWKLQRYNMAALTLRPEQHEVHCDVEQVLFTRGDLIRLQHDIPLFGLGAGRVKAVAVDGGSNATGVTLDEPLTMEAGKQYGGRFVKQDATHVVAQFVTVAGAQTVLTFVTAIPSATKPQVGNLVALGLYALETVEMLVKSIEPGPDYSATVHLVDYAPGVQAADSGVIPPFDSQITQPLDLIHVLPVPIIDQVVSDESVLFRDVDGSFQSRILISLHFNSGVMAHIAYVEAQYRPASTQAGWAQLRQPVSGTASQVSIQPVQDGALYDIRLRNVSEIGQTSDWVTIQSHLVVGKTSPPPDVALLIFDGDLLRWSYPSPPPDLAGFLVKTRPGTDPTWTEGTPIHDALIAETYVPLITDGIVRVFMVKAVDTAGNESATPASAIYAGGPLVLGNLAQTLDYRALGFPGTTVNGTVVSSDLKADSETVFWTNDEAGFWNTDSATFWTGAYKTMTYTFTVTPDASWLTGKMRIGLGITAGRWSLTYRPDVQSRYWSTDAAAFWSSDATLFWQGTKPDLMTWPGAIGPMSAQQYEFQIVANGGQVQASITGLLVLFDMPTLEESFPLFSIPSIGRRLPLTRAYHTITSVQTQPVNDGGAMRRVVVMDHDYLAGPLLEGRDSAELAVAGLSNVDIKGY